MKKLKSLIGNRSPIRLGYHYLKALIAAIRYGFPARKLIILGITGTDGKTTTVGMTAHILHEHGLAVGALSTAFFRVKDDIRWNKTEKTSPNPFVIQRFLRELVDAGCSHAVLEYSSHGLVQGRVHYTWPYLGAITNISPEHLDYHKTMKQYKADKQKLFTMLRRRSVKVLNAQDETYEPYSKVPTSITLAFNAPEPQTDELRLSTNDVQATSNGSTAILNITSDSYNDSVPLELPIPGAFNLENAQCAVACASAVGIPMREAAHYLTTFSNAPGRMEPIDEGQDFSVFIDFAVTPGSFEKTLGTMRAINPDGRILVLTGSCGDRMREKRPIIGKLCSELADVLVLTDDEPYTEDPQQILDELWTGVDESQVDATQIRDREEAINFIVSQAEPGDTVVLCGLGSYPSRMMADGLMPWDEQGITRKALQALQHDT